MLRDFFEGSKFYILWQYNNLTGSQTGLVLTMETENFYQNNKTKLFLFNIVNLFSWGEGEVVGGKGGGVIKSIQQLYWALVCTHSASPEPPCSSGRGRTPASWSCWPLCLHGTVSRSDRGTPRTSSTIPAAKNTRIHSVDKNLVFHLWAQRLPPGSRNFCK